MAREWWNACHSLQGNRKNCSRKRVSQVYTKEQERGIKILEIFCQKWRKLKCSLEILSKISKNYLKISLGFDFSSNRKILHGLFLVLQNQKYLTNFGSLAFFTNIIRFPAKFARIFILIKELHYGSNKILFTFLRKFNSIISIIGKFSEFVGKLQKIENLKY